MKYKLLNKRPELSPEQINSGMNFGELKNKSLLLQKAALKSFISKLLILTLAAGIVVTYSILKKKNIVKKQEINTESKSKPINNELQIVISQKDSINEPNKILIKKPERPIEQFSVEPLEKLSDDVKTDSVKSEILEKQVSSAIIENKNVPTESAFPVAKPKSSGKRDSMIECRILHETDKCVLDKSLPFVKKFDCDECDFDYVDCNDLNDRGHDVAVLVMLHANGTSKFNIESHLENFALINSKGHKYFPVAIAITRDKKYLSNNLKAKHLVARFENTACAVLFFTAGQIGDTIIFDNFHEAVIQE